MQAMDYPKLGAASILTLECIAVRARRANTRLNFNHTLRVLKKTVILSQYSKFLWLSSGE